MLHNKRQLLYLQRNSIGHTLKKLNDNISTRETRKDTAAKANVDQAQIEEEKSVIIISICLSLVMEMAVPNNFIINNHNIRESIKKRTLNKRNERVNVNP